MTSSDAESDSKPIIIIIIIGEAMYVRGTRTVLQNALGKMNLNFVLSCQSFDIAE